MPENLALKRIHALWIMLVVIILDQATKIYIRASMEVGESFPVLGELFKISHVENTGAAFSISLPNPAYNRIFFIFTTLVAVAFIYYLIKQALHRIQIYAFGLVLGGALGNLIDRVLFGRVTDFFDADFPDFIMYRWPVFNIADSAIVIAMALIVYDMFFIKDKLPQSEDQYSKQTKNPEEG